MSESKPANPSSVNNNSSSIDFTNTEIAFSAKSDKELKKMAKLFY